MSAFIFFFEKKREYIRGFDIALQLGLSGNEIRERNGRWKKENNHAIFSKTVTRKRRKCPEKCL